MKKMRASSILFAALVFGIGLTNVPTLVKTAIAGSCGCSDGCPCGHCSGKAKDCNCKK
ncbi:MAG: hypothetical protein HW390_3383 [Candidatus Brocadiaceae bacterium]|nr:hypothetical protein [Candidatus Brocadiaceae bacterium]